MKIDTSCVLTPLLFISLVIARSVFVSLLKSLDVNARTFAFKFVPNTVLNDNVLVHVEVPDELLEEELLDEEELDEELL